MADARAKFGARNQAEARRTALGIVETLLDDYLGQGQPYNEGLEDDIPEADMDRLFEALDRIRGRLADLKQGRRR